MNVSQKKMLFSVHKNRIIVWFSNTMKLCKLTDCSSFGMWFKDQHCCQLLTHLQAQQDKNRQKRTDTFCYHCCKWVFLDFHFHISSVFLTFLSCGIKYKRKILWLMYASRIVSFKKKQFNKIYQIKSMVNYHENLITVHIKKKINM